MFRTTLLNVVTCYAILCVLTVSLHAQTYSELVKQDQPFAWWRFEDAAGTQAVSQGSASGLTAHMHGNATFEVDGPQPSVYSDFTKENRAVKLGQGANYFKVDDPENQLAFRKGEEITIEAWVQIDEDQRGSYKYLIGKGRTFNDGFSKKNQNFSLRLLNNSSGLFLSFFFVDEDMQGNGAEVGEDGHRWNSTVGVPADVEWHHVAVTYKFGEPKSIRGYIDGSPVSGKWDMGGETTKGPVVDTDEVWIGSSMGGSSTLAARIDELAIYRKALTEKQLKKHATIKWDESPYSITEVREDAPEDHVRVELMEAVPVDKKWTFRMKEPEFLFATDSFAMEYLPRKYNSKGLIVDRQYPALLHMLTKVNLTGGKYEFILRSLDGARLYIDGKNVAETPFMSLNGSAHQEYYYLPEYGDDLLSIPAGHFEKRVSVELEPGTHVVSLYRLVGHKGKGTLLGELTVGYARQGELFKFLSPKSDRPYTDASWLAWREQDRELRRDRDQQQRLQASQQEQQRWAERHAWAKTQIKPVNVPQSKITDAIQNDIDQFINSKLEGERLSPTRLTSDDEFLRRLCLDTIGTIPSTDLIDHFYTLPPESRRSSMIDYLLEQPQWADHWVSYWQDALAENPGLTKPELNNTGPFRWFLYESFLDNKPFDRFVTELIGMEGSAYSGGPAGFGIASQNDVPMAAKAHVVGTAFLAVEMKCARCHDAPYHDVKQEDLFSIAAMLKRGDQKVPGSSTIPLTPEELEDLVVKVTLQPGTDVKPAWPFTEFVSLDEDQTPLPSDLSGNKADSRHELAVMITSPHNTRFAKVIANRLWKRYLGRGIVNDVDDWQEAGNSHPQLLSYLANQLIEHDYDLKQLAKLIFNSHVYQRVAISGLVENSNQAAFFEGPIRRKMTGEQLADSLYLAVGKSFGSEQLTMDADGKQADSRFGHLGIPERSWELMTVSNERDRPSMSLPVAQSLIDLMSAYGWRAQRQDPITEREDPLTALQPMALANGTSSNRAIDFSDQSALTQEALEDQPVEEFINAVYQRLLTRAPSSEERELFVSILKPGYADRIVADESAVPPKRIFRTGITWINHFHPDADREAMDRQREILKGDAPSVRLNKDWRIRAEDMAWVLINSPEFVFIP